MNWRSLSSINLPAEMFEKGHRKAVVVLYGLKMRRAQSAGFRAAHYGSATSSRDFVNDDLVGDAAQRRLFLNGLDRRLAQDFGDRGRLDNGARDMHGVRHRQS